MVEEYAGLKPDPGTEKTGCKKKADGISTFLQKQPVWC